MPGSALSHLACAACDRQFNADEIAQTCRCGSPLLARYDLERAAASATPDEIDRRPDSLWRWAELLPVRERKHRVTLGEQSTPIVPLLHLSRAFGFGSIAVKDESLLPTGSFKARGAAVGVSRALELGVRAFAMPTNGNAGGAWAAYGRRAGMDAHIAMPKSAPAVHRFECACMGADLVLVDGLISDAGKLVTSWVRQRGLYDASTLKEPYRLEGKKTIGFEIAMQCEWSLPDVILYPTGGGVGLIGIDKGWSEMRAMGWLDERKPRIVAVQASGCAPIVRAWEARAHASSLWEHAHTAAFGINVPKALGDFLVLQVLYASDGCAIGVDDAEMIDARDRIARDEGVLLCLEGAATIAAALRLRESGWIREGERVLAINTGSPFKHPQ